MRMNRKTAAIILSILMLILCITGCGTAAPASGSGSSQTQAAAEQADQTTNLDEETESYIPEDVSETEEGLSESETIEEESAYIDIQVVYYFRNERLLNQHYEKHGIEMGFDSAEAYEAAANLVIHNPDALHKIESEDGDDIYYVEDTNEFVVVSTDGYIRTYFLPSAGIRYYERQ